MLKNGIQKGFTLVEVAIVLVIVALLLGGLLIPLSTQLTQQRITENQRLLDEIKEALIGYAASHPAPAPDLHPYLPCPDKTTGGGAGTANDGQEDRNVAGSCVTQEGNIPWVTLGITPFDSSGNRFHYRVTAAFSNSTTGFTLSSTGDLRVCAAAGCAVVIANQVPAVILSYGPNGYGAINSAGNQNPAASSADELENTNGNTDFVSRGPTNTSSNLGEFDDVVAWLSPGLLFNRMVVAGRLP